MTGEEYEALIFSACEEFFLGLAEGGTYTSEEEFVACVTPRLNEIAWEASRSLADDIGIEALAHSDDLFTYYAQEDLAGRSDLVLARLAVKTDCYLCLSALVEALSAEANHDEMAATEITPEQEEEISRGYI